jgi:ASC-1-like (ASCH) protein
MRKSWGLTEKILSGEKKIESRWYINRSNPWNNINSGDIVYFKNSGEPITIKATVFRVLQFDNLTPAKVKSILIAYGSSIGIDKKDIDIYFDNFKNKNYCILIFLSNVKAVKPFEINKTGFGAMSSWLTVSNLKQIKKQP